MLLHYNTSFYDEYLERIAAFFIDSVIFNVMESVKVYKSPALSLVMLLAQIPVKDHRIN